LISQICVEPQPTGLRAVYLVETQSEQQAKELSRHFGDFASALKSYQLSKGKLVSYAVQLRGQDSSILDEIESFLKQNFEFVILHRAFDALIYDIVRELCKDSGSTLAPVPKCDICGKPEPFPETTIRFLDKENVSLDTRLYCATCTAESARRSNKEFLRALLQADRSDFRTLQGADLVRYRTSKKHIAFRIKSASAQCAAS
jgi:hypothetical protein